MTIRLRSRRDGPERRQHRWQDSAEFFAICLAIVLWAVMVVLVLNAQDELGNHQKQLDREAQQIGAQRTSLIESCNRLQIQRIEDNINHYADYRVFKVVYIAFAGASQLQGGTAQEQQFNKTFVPELAKSIAAKTWVPRTDCTKVVNTQGIHYRAPGPIPFVKQLPPADALQILPMDLQ